MAHQSDRTIGYILNSLFETRFTDASRNVSWIDDSFSMKIEARLGFENADDHAYLRRPTPVRDRWTSHIVPPNEAPRLAALFDEVWERADVHPDLRSMHI